MAWVQILTLPLTMGSRLTCPCLSSTICEMEITIIPPQKVMGIREAKLAKHLAQHLALDQEELIPLLMGKSF